LKGKNKNTKEVRRGRWPIKNELRQVGLPLSFILLRCWNADHCLTHLLICHSFVKRPWLMFHPFSPSAPIAICFCLSVPFPLELTWPFMFCLATATIAVERCICPSPVNTFYDFLHFRSTMPALMLLSYIYLFNPC